MAVRGIVYICSDRILRSGSSPHRQQKLYGGTERAATVNSNDAAVRTRPYAHSTCHSTIPPGMAWRRLFYLPRCYKLLCHLCSHPTLGADEDTCWRNVTMQWKHESTEYAQHTDVYSRCRIQLSVHLPYKGDKHRQHQHNRLWLRPRCDRSGTRHINVHHHNMCARMVFPALPHTRAGHTQHIRQLYA